jgi:hypothetical protein
MFVKRALLGHIDSRGFSMHMAEDSVDVTDTGKVQLDIAM